jgi:hypothetical protein
MHGGEGIYRVDLSAEVSREELLPEIKLKTAVQVRPQWRKFFFTVPVLCNYMAQEPFLLCFRNLHG